MDGAIRFEETPGVRTMVSPTKPLPVREYILGVQIGTDQYVTFANNAPANTQQSVTVAKPTQTVRRYKVVVYNPSAITDLTVKVMEIATAFGGADRDSIITTLSVPKSQSVTGTTISSQTFFIEGLFCGADCKFIFSNNTVLGAADQFSPYIRIREAL